MYHPDIIFLKIPQFEIHKITIILQHYYEISNVHMFQSCFRLTTQIPLKKEPVKLLCHLFYDMDVG